MHNLRFLLGRVRMEKGVIIGIRKPGMRRESNMGFKFLEQPPPPNPYPT
jgi:hypothetical protein